MPLRKGPYDRLLFERDTLCVNDPPKVLGLLDQGRWVLPEGAYMRIDVHGPLGVTLLRPAASYLVYGPYAHFSFVDGVAYGDGTVFAFIDGDVKDWYSLQDNRHWTSLQITPSASVP
jgi:hypothetical protein